MDLLLRRYFWVINLTIIGLCASLVGRAASHMVEGAYLAGEDTRTTIHRRRAAFEPPKSHGKETQEIVERNLFCSSCVPVKKGPTDGRPEGPGSNEPQKTSLQIELVSTMVVPSDDAWSMAVLRDLSTKEKDSEMFNRGKKVFATSAVIKKVLPKRVYFDNEGRVEYVELDGAAAPATPAPATPAPPVAAAQSGPSEFGDLDKQIQCTGTNCTIERQLVDKALSNTAALGTMARFVPSVRDGKPNGFKVYAIRPNSLFGKIGMQNGDTLKQINGNEMSTPDQALQLYTKLRSASHLTLQVERRGETVTMDYTIR
jgi:general secretion pathway protein C